MFGQSLLSAFGSAACTTDTDQLFATDVQTTSTATYQLNNATTSIPSNTYPGTPSNITYAAGKFGNAAVFNGTSSNVSINSSTALQLLGDYTVSFWFKTNAVSGTQRLVNKDNANDFSGGWGFSLYSNSTFNWSHNDGSNNQNWNINAGTISTNTWYNVCAVYSDSNNLRTFYLNGSSVGTIATNTNVAASTDNLFFGTYGASSPGGQYLNGSLDQVRIFNSVLPQAAVTALYNETTTTATYDYVEYEGANPNSIAYYKMSDATDQLGNYNGTATNVNFNTEGKFGFAGKFSRSGSSFVNTNFTNTLSSASFSFWVKVPSSQPTGSMRLLSSVSINPLRAGQWSFIYNGSGTVSFQLVTNGGAVTNLPNVSFSLDTWEHFVFTYDNSINTAKVYLNGNTTPVSTATIGTINETNNTTPLYLGFYPRASTYDSDSTYDQIRIYDSALSAENVTTLYNEIECPAVPILAYYLVVGGGGGGGGRHAGGGGAGGYLTNYGSTSLSLDLGTSYDVTVGLGGAGAPNGTATGTGSVSGQDSIFSNITSTGGGGGGGPNGVESGKDGGSGGASSYIGAVGTGNTPSTTPSQGNNGGSGAGSTYVGGGGGGAGAIGGNFSGSTAGSGGAGEANTITGSSTFYAGGGGGGGWVGNTA